MSPVNLLLSKLIATKMFHCIQQSGVSLDKRLSARLRICNCFDSFILQHKISEMDAERELLERSNSVTPEEIQSNGPSM